MPLSGRLCGTKMYGLVNQGVKAMVMDAGGESLWQTVREKAGLELDEFLSMQPYEDVVTMSLVDAASQVLDTPAAELLEGFGQYWIGFTAKTGWLRDSRVTPKHNSTRASKTFLIPAPFLA